MIDKKHSQIIQANLPEPITPRPGERVVAYQGRSRHEGVFLGYNTADELLVKAGEEAYIKISHHLQLRPVDPFMRAKPCWQDYLQELAIAATDDEKSRINTLLDRFITPGPSYMELIREIWSRGYETFLVGGGVRDALNGETPKDVDLVTTIPFQLLGPLVTAMFGDDGYSRKPQNGFMSVGLDAAKYNERSVYDPLIDVKNIFTYAPGTNDAQFGSNISHDLKFRDFACNAIYYEPVNGFFIDPSGLGIKDAKTRTLNLVNNTTEEHPRYKKANISFRFFKFVRRGFTPTDECVEGMNSTIKPLFSSIGHVYRISLFKSYFLEAGGSKEVQGAILVEVRDLMKRYGYGEIWDEFFAKFESDLIDGEQTDIQI